MTMGWIAGTTFVAMAVAALLPKGRRIIAAAMGSNAKP
jgi:hypothetical protein